MNKIFILLIVVFFINVLTFSQTKSNMQFSGYMESKFNFVYSKKYSSEEDVADYGKFGWGWENIANLRFKTTINEYLSFGFAINIHTITGNYTDIYKQYYLAESISSIDTIIDPKNINTGYYSIPFYIKNTYVGAFELERLYFKAGNNYFDIESGLLRIARGYGYSFSPTDFFNPRNPLDQEARPEGKLAVVGSFYPLDMWKIQLFAVAPDNPIDSSGWGFKFGTATNFSIGKFNFEFLYSLLMPDIEYGKDPESVNLTKSVNNNFTHIAGFSMKADITIGLFIDMVYKFDQRAMYYQEYYGKEFRAYDGLEAAIGIDYTLPGGKVYLLLEYMFYGSGMVDWDKQDFNDLYTISGWEKYSPSERYQYTNTDKKQLNFLRHDYIFAEIKVKVNDYLNVVNTILIGADDISAITSTFLEIEPFQSFTITIGYMTPLDLKMLDSQRASGEFGSTNLGFSRSFKLSVKVKF